MLRNALADIREVQSKTLSIKNSEVIVQHNPHRIVSTAARIDSAAIKQRPCFLCPQNLPLEEKGIAFTDEFVVLCNPFPVLNNHLVITSRQHTPQLIEGHLGLILDLAREMGDEWFTLYNGPRCGASAPDHLHFQACSSDILPIFREIKLWDRYLSVSDYRINLLIARGSDRNALLNWFNNTVMKLGVVMKESEEPMINVIVKWENGRWMIIIFPRGKHRPSSYYLDGEERLTVSPAAIDLGGVLVVPEDEHFSRIGADDVQKIYAEVTLDNERFNRLITR